LDWLENRRVKWGSNLDWLANSLGMLENSLDSWVNSLDW